MCVCVCVCVCVCCIGQSAAHKCTPEAEQLMNRLYVFYEVLWRMCPVDDEEGDAGGCCGDAAGALGALGG